MLSPQSWLHFWHQASQDRALAPVMATLRAPAGSHPKSLNPSGHAHTIVFFQSGCSWPLGIVLSPRSWLHFWHQASQDRALASVLATLRAPVGSQPKSWNPSGHRDTIVFSNQDALGSSESCSRLGPGYISGTRLLRIVLSPQSWPHFGPL